MTSRTIMTIISMAIISDFDSMDDFMSQREFF
jgi:hypothetical protein